MRLFRLLKRKILMVVMMFMLLLATPVPVYATGTPVFDFTALVNSVKEFVTTVQYYQEMINKTKREYERIRNAAKMISEGSFEERLMGIANIATQVAGWDSTSESMSQTLKEISKTAKYGTTLKGTFENIKNKFNVAGELWENAIESIQQGMSDGSGKDWWDTMDNIVYGVSGLSDSITEAVEAGGDVVTTALRITERVVNPITSLVGVFTNMDVEIMEQQIEDLKAACEKLYDEKIKILRNKRTAQKNGETAKVEEYDSQLTENYNQIAEISKKIEKLQAEVDKEKEKINNNVVAKINELLDESIGNTLGTMGNSVMLNTARRAANGGIWDAMVYRFKSSPTFAIKVEESHLETYNTGSSFDSPNFKLPSSGPQGFYNTGSNFDSPNFKLH